MAKVSKRKQELLEISDVCINCGSHLALNQRFCPNCGGKRIYNRITWRNLFEDFIDRFFNIENAFLKTFLALFKSPEDVIGGYIKGMRKKYLPAFSYFAVALTVAGVYSFIIKNWFLEDVIQAQTNYYTGEAAEIQKLFMSQWVKGIIDYQSIFYFAMIPILAILSKVVFWNYKKYNLVEHFVIYLYGYSHIALITTILGLLVIWNQSLHQIYGILSPLLMIGYMTYVLKRLFKLNTGSTILKFGLFLLVSFVFIIFLSIIGGIIGFVIGMSGAFDDAEFVKIIKKQAASQKALKEATKMAKDSISRDSLKQVIKTVKDSIHK